MGCGFGYGVSVMGFGVWVWGLGISPPFSFRDILCLVLVVVTLLAALWIGCLR